MKLLLLALLFSLPAFSQTLESEKIKELMLQRAQDMRLASDEGRELMQDLKLEEGCQKIAFIFKEMPQHLSSIMSRMNIFDRKIQLLKDESLTLLTETHRLHVKCGRGENQEYVDADKAQRFLKDFSKKMKKHEKQIKKSPTNFNNTYYYHYEF